MARAELAVSSLAKHHGMKLERLRTGYAIRNTSGRYLFTVPSLGSALDLILMSPVQHDDIVNPVNNVPPEPSGSRDPLEPGGNVLRFAD